MYNVKWCRHSNESLTIGQIVTWIDCTFEVLEINDLETKMFSIGDREPIELTYANLKVKPIKPIAPIWIKDLESGKIGVK